MQSVSHLCNLCLIINLNVGPTDDDAFDVSFRLTLPPNRRVINMGRSANLEAGVYIGRRRIRLPGAGSTYNLAGETSMIRVMIIICLLLFCFFSVEAERQDAGVRSRFPDQALCRIGDVQRRRFYRQEQGHVIPGLQTSPPQQVPHK